MRLNEAELKKNYQDVKERIARAAQRAGRDPAEIKLLAVSKTKPLEDIQVLHEQGQTAFGENYSQELAGKAEAMPDLEWHMIGHLQRNKVKYIIDKVKLTHAVDSLRLAEMIEKEAVSHDTEANILLEVNMAEEESKFGFKAEETAEAAEAIGKLEHVHILGLMTSAPFTNDPETNRPYFRAMKELAQTITEKHFDNVKMDILSMGMTRDFEIAIEEGATIVRVGTALFGEREYGNKEKL